MLDEKDWAKVTKNRSAFQVNIPIQMIRGMGLDANKPFEVKRYYTKGKGKQVILRFRYLNDKKSRQMPRK